jgi:adenylate kinase family enzyme
VNPDIVLIGPVRTGKSTLGHLLVERLGLPQISVDTVYTKDRTPQEACDDILRRITR